MRGAKPKPDTCRKCDVNIVRPVTNNKRRKKDRLCNECATEIVMVRKWKKKGDAEIEKRIRQLEKIILILNKAKEGIPHTMKNIEINIYPVAYVCVNDSVLVDEIDSTFNHQSSGDGQLMCNLESLDEEVEQMEDCELKTTMQGMLSEIGGKAGDILFYAR